MNERMAQSALMVGALLSIVFPALAQGPAFQNPPSNPKAPLPAGWMATKGGGEGVSLLSERSAPLALQTANKVSLPIEAEFRLRLKSGDNIHIAARGSDPKAPPLLETRFILGEGNNATVRALTDGKPMATEPVASRPWHARDKNSGTLSYTWRYPRVRNSWDARDRQEIGAAYTRLVPFADKTFAVRLMLTRTARQIWVDDRLVAEAREPGPSFVDFAVEMTKGVQLLSGDFKVPNTTWKWTPLHLSSYSHAQADPNRRREPLLKLRLPGGENLPVFLSPATEDVNLGDSLYRFRTSAGSGPFNGYINALKAYPDPFTIDPAELSFRVPYRDYQNAWLVVWLDNAKATVPRGVFRFYRTETGTPAATPFSVDQAAMDKGLVTKLPFQMIYGKTLYLVKVPLDTDAMNAYRDQSDQFLDFQLPKPTYAMRTYPDPIYYGEHPGGLPSSVHVAAITLETAPFRYDVQAGAFGHVYEAPAQASYTVRVTNISNKPLTAKVFLATRSFDGEEKTTRSSTAAIAPGKTVNALFSLKLKKYGWHELKATVIGGAARRTETLSLVRLPANRRTYGNAVNETRFGAWVLWGHYTPFGTDPAANEPALAMLRKLGIRRIGAHNSFVDPKIAQRYNFLPVGSHTTESIYWKVNENDPVALQKAVDDEIKAIAPVLEWWPHVAYMYGGEWAMSRDAIYAPDPRYTGDGPRELTDEEKGRVARQGKIFEALGAAIRKNYPGVRLALQWGGPQATVPFLRSKFPREYIDMFGMDLPEFEILPEASNTVSPINILWTLRKEAARLGYPRYPIHWAEGPFFPTNIGALTERDQADYQIRAWLLGLAYGIDEFASGIVPFDAGNYYGSEHYGQGIFHAVPRNNPKPAVAAVATATSMLCGADPVGGVPTGNLATYCMMFRRAKTGGSIYALWRVRGTANATIKLNKPGRVQLTDSMGNAVTLKVAPDGSVVVPITSAPAWLTGAGLITGIRLDAPQYSEKPAATTLPLPEFTAANWRYDGSEDTRYARNHFAVRRVTDAGLHATFGKGEVGHPNVTTITLPIETGDRPLANRYGALVPRRLTALTGKPKALGVWVKGNASWGRIAYQLRDAHGEVWLSTGSKDEWNCDDTHGWQSVNFEGWRYLRFPLPGNRPWDNARELESTWWGSHNGDGIVDYPLTLEKIFVEARNEVPYLGVMKMVPGRSYALSGLVVEYNSPADTTLDAVKQRWLRMPTPSWQGPQENPIERLTKEGVGEAPPITGFTEPGHFNDGRRMVIHFTAAPNLTYNLYLSLYPDGRGAELLARGVKDNQEITGLRPEVPQYLFLTAVDEKKQESKPSAAYNLITHDNFAEK